MVRGGDGFKRDELQKNDLRLRLPIMC